MLGASSLSPAILARLERGFTGEDGRGQDKSWSSESFLVMVSDSDIHRRERKEPLTCSGYQPDYAVFLAVLPFHPAVLQWMPRARSCRRGLKHAFVCPASPGSTDQEWQWNARRSGQPSMSRLRLRSLPRRRAGKRSFTVNARTRALSPSKGARPVRSEKKRTEEKSRPCA